jgi:hypothetical protein
MSSPPRQSTTHIDRGLASELWVLNLLTEQGVTCRHTGCLSGHLFDHLVTDDTKVERGVQVKTATLNRDGSYSVPTVRRSREKYPANTLLIGVDLKRTIFYVSYTHEVDCDTVCVNFGAKPSTPGKYSRFVYQDLAAFTSKVASLIPGAVDVATVPKLFSASGEKEAAMIANLRKRFTVKDPLTPYGDVDCLVDEVPSQLKAVQKSIPGENTIDLHIYHTVDLQRLPYSADTDFHILIIQNLEYPDDFLVIPKVTLVKYGCLASLRHRGRIKLTMPCSPVTKHWLSYYWNRFDLLTAIDFKPPPDVFDPVVDSWLAAGHDAYVDHSTLMATDLVVDDMIVRAFTSPDDRYTLCGSSDCQALIFIGKEHMWLIPVEVLVHRQYMSADGAYLKRVILMNNERWLRRYQDNLNVIFQQVDLVTDNYDALTATWCEVGHRARTDRSDCNSISLVLNDERVEISQSGSSRVFRTKDCVAALGICFMNNDEMWLLPKQALIDRGYLDGIGVALKPTFNPNDTDPFFTTFYNNPDSLFGDVEIPEDPLERVVRLYREQGKEAHVDRTHLKALKIVVAGSVVKVVVTRGDSAYILHKINNVYRPYCLADGYAGFLFLRPDKSFYLLPTAVLRENGYVGVKEGEGKKSIAVHKAVKWIQKYRNCVSS